MFCWGNTVNGELGLGGIEEEKILVPRELLVSTFDTWSVKQVACGENHTVFLLTSGKVYACGSNDHGQLGMPFSTKKPIAVEGLTGSQIAQVVCGSHHTLALSEWGGTYSFGHNAYGQLGRKSEDVNDSTPKLVKVLAVRKVVQLACGAQHNLALTESGHLFSWGKNTYGQLGLGFTSECEQDPAAVKALEGIPIVQMACGCSHCFVISRLGAVIGWGRGSFGQLGQNDENCRSTPTPLEPLRSHGAKHVACGENHTAILTQDGGVFTFGAGSYGQLGHGNYDNKILPSKVMELMGSTITQIACGRRHTLVYEPIRGRVYAFGQGGSGQLGTGAKDNCWTPTVSRGDWGAPSAGSTDSEDLSAKSKNKKVVKRVFCGWDQSFIVLADKKSPPEDLRVLPTGGQVQSLRYDMAAECAAIPETKLISQDTLQYVETVFSSPACVNASFVLGEKNGHVTLDSKDPRIHWEEANSFFAKLGEIKRASLIELIQESLRTELIPSLGPSPIDWEAMRVYLILMQCHLLDDPIYYNALCAPLGKAILSLAAEPARILDAWWANLASPDFQRLVTIYKKCVVAVMNAIRDRTELAGVGTTHAERLVACLEIFVKVLNKLNLVNRMHGYIVPYETFYIPEINEMVDVRRDYFSWQNRTRFCQQEAYQQSDSGGGHFYLCDYPFLFDARAKTLILQADAILQMQNAMDEVTLRNLNYLFMPVDPANPYLVLAVTRENLVQDTLDQLVNLQRHDLKKPLKVVFRGEEAVDGGGVRKEFFMLLMKDLVDPKYGMFKEYDETGCIWFNEKTFEGRIMFSLIGQLCGLAVYNGNIVNLPFPVVLYKKLLNESLTLDDLADLSPSLHRNLRYLLEYAEDDFDDVFSQTFEINVEAFGTVETYELKPGGRDVLVTKENREAYVGHYVDFLLNRVVHDQYDAFHEGFHRLLDEHLLQLFHAQELMVMVVGNENYDWDELEANAEYKEDYAREHPTIRLLWEVFRELDMAQKKKFLLFLTGYERIPIFGMQSVKLTIQPTGGGEDFLPVAHTCFNLLDLPRYTRKEKLREKLLLAIEHTQGFGLA